MSWLKSIFASVVLVLSIGMSTPATAAPLQTFVSVNGVRLEVLDWGGEGSALVLVPGMGGSPYSFDDFAPAFVDRFHVISFARRGTGNSDVAGPYDVATSTDDL